MINRTTAIAFLMLASIIIMAHAVVPHHHHNRQVCLVKTHCLDDDSGEENGTTGNSHSHDGDNNSDGCVLKEPVVVITNQLKTDFKLNNKPDRSNLYDFQYNLLNSSDEFHIPVLSCYIHDRCTESSYSSLISACIGLRAPPSV